MVNLFKKPAQFLSSQHNEFTFKETFYSGNTYSFLITEDLSKPVVISKFINSLTDDIQIVELSKKLKDLKPMQNVTLKISHFLNDGKIKESIEEIIF